MQFEIPSGVLEELENLSAEAVTNIEESLTARQDAAVVNTVVAQHPDFLGLGQGFPTIGAISDSETSENLYED
jgi:hypothetical protein